ncbi:hypothetical protein [Nicoliella lavandulae]|uniref:Uncharacterized protein n=1 Tax=Nicoliella lavandulae TaxID=3082954 RepID=A0ABU8SJ23_9LACO
MNLIKSNSYKEAVYKVIHKNGKPKSKKEKIGFYKHHIMEFIVPNINKNKIRKENKINGVSKNELKKWDSSDYMVNCDLVEHLILHVLIIADENNTFSFENHDSLEREPLKYEVKEITAPSKSNENDDCYKKFFNNQKNFKYYQVLIKYSDNDEYTESSGVNSLFGMVMKWYLVCEDPPECEKIHKEKYDLSPSQTIKLIEQINYLLKPKQKNG